MEFELINGTRNLISMCAKVSHVEVEFLRNDFADMMTPL